MIMTWIIAFISYWLAPIYTLGFVLCVGLLVALNIRKDWPFVARFRRLSVLWRYALLAFVVVMAVGFAYAARGSLIFQYYMVNEKAPANAIETTNTP